MWQSYHPAVKLHCIYCIIDEVSISSQAFAQAFPDASELLSNLQSNLEVWTEEENLEAALAGLP